MYQVIQPLVSVIIPTYNRAYILPKAIESVLNQTYPNLELIIIDDASTDETEELVKTFLKNSHIPILYKKLPFRKGPSHARNIGISLARGELIAFLDSDDWFLSQKIERQVNFLKENPEFNAVQVDELWFKQGKRIFPKRIHRKAEGYFFHRAVKLCVVSMSAVMLKKDVFYRVGFFDETFPVCEDYEFWLRFALFYPMGFIKDALTGKDGGRPDQLSSTKGLDFYRCLALIKTFQKYTPFLTPEMKLLLFKEAKKKFNIFFKGALKYGNLKNAFELKKIFEKTFRWSILSPFVSLSHD